MKFYKQIIYTLMLASVSFLTSCEDDTTGDVSRLTNFPVFELAGGNAFSIVAGSVASFEEPGVVVTEDGTEISFETDGAVDVNTPGIYPLTYSATNKDGFSKSEQRFVVVTAEDVSSIDLSGDYTSLSQSFGGQSFGQKMVVTKLADGYYQATDIYAHPAANQPARFLHTGGTEGLLQPIPSSIFGQPLIGDITIEGANLDSIAFNLTFPAAGFSTTKPWVKE